jgi:hypothetical protein
MHHVRLRPRASFTPDELEQLARWLEVATTFLLARGETRIGTTSVPGRIS